MEQKRFDFSAIQYIYRKLRKLNYRKKSILFSFLDGSKKLLPELDSLRFAGQLKSRHWSITARRTFRQKSNNYK